MPDPDPIRFREAFGRFPTGVAIITAPGGGMTANAVCSLSLDPLLVLVCFDKTARTLPLVHETRRLRRQHPRAGHHEGLAAHFASKLPEAEKLATTAHDLESGVPVLDDALAWMVVRPRAPRTRRRPRDRHGRVTSLGIEEGEPLVWYRGDYQTLAD